MSRRQKETIALETFISQLSNAISVRLMNRIDNYILGGMDDIAAIELYLNIKYIDNISFEDNRTKLSVYYTKACERLGINGSEILNELSTAKTEKKDMQVVIANKIEELRKAKDIENISDSNLVNIYNNESIETKMLVEIQKQVANTFNSYYEVNQIPDIKVKEVYKNAIGTKNYKVKVDSLFIIANKINENDNFGYYVGIDKETNEIYTYPIGTLLINGKLSKLGWSTIYATVGEYEDLTVALQDILKELNVMKIAVEGTK